MTDLFFWSKNTLTLGKTAIRICVHVHGYQMMNPIDFDDPLRLLCGFEWNISTTIQQIVMKLATQIHFLSMINPCIFGEINKYQFCLIIWFITRFPLLSKLLSAKTLNWDGEPGKHYAYWTSASYHFHSDQLSMLAFACGSKHLCA